MRFLKCGILDDYCNKVASNIQRLRPGSLGPLPLIVEPLARKACWSVRPVAQQAELLRGFEEKLLLPTSFIPHS